MSRCFVCKEWYDDTNPEIALWVEDTKTHALVPIRNVCYGSDNEKVALCPKCVRAATLSTLSNDKRYRVLFGYNPDETTDADISDLDTFIDTLEK